MPSTLRRAAALIFITLHLTAAPAFAADRLKVVASFTIIGDFARNVGGERIELTTLVGPDGELLAEALNTVVTEGDLSAHPELELAVWAGRNLDPEAAGRTTMYTSCENCAMCSAAMVWSGLGTLVYALSGRSLIELQPAGGTSLALPSPEVFARSSRPIEVRGPALEAEARAAHAGYWAG